ncbi:hypothetical protein N7467_000764 [Penicillium canescens]|nr:hypothetical protein N7467_000764 [Penicillium canescens]
MADFLRNPRPWDNPYNDTTHHPAKHIHELVYPTTNETNGERTRTHHAHGRDAQEIRIKRGEEGEYSELRIVNIYNPVGCIYTIIKLGGILGKGCIHLALSPVTNRATRPLLTYLLERFLVSEIAHECYAHSDHLPIRTIINMDTTEPVQPRRRNWKTMDTDKFDKFVASKLRMPLLRHLSTPQQIHEAVEHFMEVINRAVEDSTLWANPTFTVECLEAIKATRRLFRPYTSSPDEDDWKEYKSARNQKGRVIKKALWIGFREFVKEAIN